MGVSPNEEAGELEKTAEVQEYIVHETEKKPLGKRILWIFWDSGGKDPETRAYVNRLDSCFLLYTMYTYIMKYVISSRSPEFA